jgi:hypothetical protein
MRNSFETPIKALAATATQTSSAVIALQLYRGSVQASFSAANSGTLKLQASNDVPPGSPAYAFTPTNWVDVPGATSTIAGVTSALIPTTEFSYYWLRLVWTPTAGAGTITAQLNALGF